jgi:hypothetical protein
MNFATNSQGNLRSLLGSSWDRIDHPWPEAVQATERCLSFAPSLDPEAFLNSLHLWGIFINNHIKFLLPMGMNLWNFLSLLCVPLQ